MTGNSTSQNLERINPPESKKIKLEVSNTNQAQKISNMRSEKGLNKLELYRQALQCKEAEQNLLATSQSETSTGMKSAEDSIALSDGAVLDKENVTSPRVLGLKKGCTFSKGFAPRRSLGLVCRQKDDVENIELKNTSKPEKGKIVIVQLEKVDDRIDRELTEDVSGEQEREAEKPNEASMKLKSTSDDDASLSFNDLENTQNTSAETATSSGKDADTDKPLSTCKSETMKSSSSSSEEGDDSNSSNSESEENGNGNASIPEYKDGDDDEYDDENDDNSSVKSQSPEKSVDDDAENTSKLDILRKKVNSPKSIASRIKDYSRKIGYKGVRYTIFGSRPKYETVAQLPRSDMKGFLSPRAKQEGFIPVEWNQEMVKSTMSEVQKQNPEGDQNIDNVSINEENISTNDMQIPPIPTDDFSLMDPSNVERLPENIFSESNPPVTSTPKTTKEKIAHQSNPSSDSTTDINKHSKPSTEGAGNGSTTDPYDETTTDKMQEMSSGDETNKPPKKAQ